MVVEFRNVVNWPTTVSELSPSVPLLERALLVVGVNDVPAVTALSAVLTLWL